MSYIRPPLNNILKILLILSDLLDDVECLLTNTALTAVAHLSDQQIDGPMHKVLELRSIQ